MRPNYSHLDTELFVYECLYLPDGICSGMPVQPTKTLFSIEERKRLARILNAQGKSDAADAVRAGRDLPQGSGVQKSFVKTFGATPEELSGKIQEQPEIAGQLKTEARRAGRQINIRERIQEAQRGADQPKGQPIQASQTSLEERIAQQSLTDQGRRKVQEFISQQEQSSLQSLSEDELKRRFTQQQVKVPSAESKRVGIPTSRGATDLLKGRVGAEQEVVEPTGEQKEFVAVIRPDQVTQVEAQTGAVATERKFLKTSTGEFVQKVTFKTRGDVPKEITLPGQEPTRVESASRQLVETSRDIQTLGGALDVGEDEPAIVRFGKGAGQVLFGAPALVFTAGGAIGITAGGLAVEESRGETISKLKMVPAGVPTQVTTGLTSIPEEFGRDPAFAAGATAGLLLPFAPKGARGLKFFLSAKPQVGDLTVSLGKTTFETRGKTTVSTTRGEIITTPKILTGFKQDIFAGSELFIRETKPRQVAEFVSIGRGRQTKTLLQTGFIQTETGRVPTFKDIPRSRGFTETGLLVVRSTEKGAEPRRFVFASRGGLLEKPTLLGELETPRGRRRVERGKIEAEIATGEVKKGKAPLKELGKFKRAEFKTLEEISGLKTEKIKSMFQRDSLRLSTPTITTKGGKRLRVKEAVKEFDISVSKEEALSLGKAEGLVTELATPETLGRVRVRDIKRKTSPIFERPDAVSALGDFVRLTEPDAPVSLRPVRPAKEAIPISGLAGISRRGTRLALEELVEDLTLPKAGRAEALAPLSLRTRVSTALGARQIETPLSKAAEKLKLREEIGTKITLTRPVPTETLTGTRTRTGILSLQITELQPLTETLTETTTRTRIAGRLSIARPLVRRPRMLPTPQRKPRRRKETRQPSGFIPQARMKGKFVDLVDESLSEGDALKLGSQIVDETSPATFRIRKSAKPVSNKTVKGQFARQKFYSKNGNFIEKNTFRIDKRGERREITEEGLRTLARERLIGGRSKVRKVRARRSGLGRLRL